jgi:hypothetical protein
MAHGGESDPNLHRAEEPDGKMKKERRRNTRAPFVNRVKTLEKRLRGAMRGPFAAAREPPQ